MKINNIQKQQILKTLYVKKLCGIQYHSYIESASKMESIVDLPNDLKTLNQYIYNCHLCELSKHKSETFLGIGDINSAIWIIGTNTNYKDSVLYTMLQNMVQKVLFVNISTIFITNILKCYTTNYNIQKEQIQKCIPFIKKQLEIVKPKLIITLGEAYEYLTDKNIDLKQNSGTISNYDDRYIVPLMDLEFVLKNPSYKVKMFQDLKKIKTIMEEL